MNFSQKAKQTRAWDLIRENTDKIEIKLKQYTVDAL